jgi:hypothetical protein
VIAFGGGVVAMAIAALPGSGCTEGPTTLPVPAFDGEYVRLRHEIGGTINTNPGGQGTTRLTWLT